VKALKQVALCVALVSALLIWCGSTARADFILYIGDNATFMHGDWVEIDSHGVIASGGQLTTFAAVGTPAGSLTWVGELGLITAPKWTVDVATAMTVPLIGTPTLPQLLLNTVDVSTGAGTLLIMATDTGYGPTKTPAEVFFSDAGALGSGASTSGFAWQDNGNNLFGKTTPQGVFGPVGPNPGPGPLAFSGNSSGPLAPPATTYSLTMESLLTHTVATTSNAVVDLKVVRPVPVPASVLLLAPGLLGLVGIRKRLRG